MLRSREINVCSSATQPYQMGETCQQQLREAQQQRRAAETSEETEIYLHLLALVHQHVVLWLAHLIIATYFNKIFSPCIIVTCVGILTAPPVLLLPILYERTILMFNMEIIER